MPKEILHPDHTTDDSDALGSTLGIPWDRDHDYFVYDFSNFMQFLGQKFSKRKLLSTLASVYDLLGLVGFALIPAKTILQSAFRSGCSRDKPLPDDLQRRVNKWIKSMSNLKFQVPRQFILSNPKNVQLHVFSAASQD